MIEPFGLLNFIQSALQSAATPPQTNENSKRQTAAPQKASPFETTPNVPPVFSTAPQTPSSPPCEGEPQKTETVLPTEEPITNNPFLNFCEEHDRRAKRVKRNP